ncbi:hypothetical protein [Candidatus Purcelliella pentastirinorum]|uniref:hypothetical protein n=1 Tax=Candidatus Purcelliella pentastirinorum TaxID=472834 RepID=UPI0039F71A06
MLTITNIYFIGVIFNYYIQSIIFNIVLNITSLGILPYWIFIILCQINLRFKINKGKENKIYFRLSLP